MHTRNRPHYAVGDATLIGAYGRERAGYIVAVSPTGLRVRVRYVSHATDRTRINERWETIGALPCRAPARATCAHCDAAPLRLTGRITAHQHNRYKTADTWEIACARHSKPTDPLLPA